MFLLLPIMLVLTSKIEWFCGILSIVSVLLFFMFGLRAVIGVKRLDLDASPCLFLFYSSGLTVLLYLTVVYHFSGTISFHVFQKLTVVLYSVF